MSGAIESLKANLAFKDDQIRNLETALATAPTKPHVGADDITQAARVVGTAIAPDIRLGEGLVLMARLNATGDFNPKEPFQFRNVKLVLDHFIGHSKSIIAGITDQQFSQVTCRVLT